MPLAIWAAGLAVVSLVVWAVVRLGDLAVVHSLERRRLVRRRTESLGLQVLTSGRGWVSSRS